MYSARILQTRAGVQSIKSRGRVCKDFVYIHIRVIEEGELSINYECPHRSLAIKSLKCLVGIIYISLFIFRYVININIMVFSQLNLRKIIYEKLERGEEGDNPRLACVQLNQSTNTFGVLIQTFPYTFCVHAIRLQYHFY